MNARGFEIPSPALSRQERRTQQRQEALTAHLKDSVARVDVDGVHRVIAAVRTVMNFEAPQTDSVAVITAGDTDIPYHVIPERANVEFEMVSGLNGPEAKLYRRAMRDATPRRLGVTGVEGAFSTFEASLGLLPDSEASESTVSA